jgi:sulfhydrogenase subunit delta
MAKPKVAFFDFTSCEGCQLNILDLGPDDFLELMDVIEIVEFREAISETADTYDIACIEGSYSREDDMERLRDIRKRAKLVIALGSCAHIGGITSIRNSQTKEQVQSIVYPDNPTLYSTNEKALPISSCIEINGFIPGCPVSTKEFVQIIKNIVLGKAPGIPTYSVCVECKQNETVCVYEKGLICLGPIIRAGCNAICPDYGGYCYGCRGTIPDANISALKEVMVAHGVQINKLEDKFTLFLNATKEVMDHV